MSIFCRNVTLLLLLVLQVIVMYAQTGPGGVGTSFNNALWLRANTGTSTTTHGAAIASWNDQSGNGNNVTQSNANQRPLYISNFMNGYPVIQFDNNNSAGQNDYLTGVDAASLDNTAGLSVFTVTRMTNLGDARNIIAKRTNVGVNQAYMFFYYTSNYMWLDVVSNDNRFSTNPTTYTTGTNYILDFIYDGTLAAASRSKIYTNNSLTTTATETNTSIPDYNSPLIIGSTHIGDNRPFGGYIAELIIFRTALGTASRIIVDNYLAAKYGINLTTNDIYTMDNVGSGNYDHEVAGIGRETSLDLNTDAQGTAIVRILNPSDLNDNEYLLWGHDNGIQQAIDTDVPAAVEARFQRVWRVSEVNKSNAAVDVGSVEIRWDLSTLGPVTASDLRLLVDTDNDGIFSDETPISSAVDLGGGIYSFTGVTALVNQRRFTLATVNQSQTPLPIELVDFTADPIEGMQVDLKWKTMSESNNDYFLVQHSKDGQQWTDKFKIDGAGNSAEPLDYTTIDKSPAMGTNYYRLKQVDFDGGFTYSEVRLCLFTPTTLEVFPNPSEQIISIEGLNETTDYLRIRNALGQLVLEINPQEFSSKQIIDISGLASGVYLIETSQGTVKFTRM